MITQISNKILQYLLNESVIEDNIETQEYYLYGIEISISSILNIFLILIIGIIFNHIKESFLFLICFIPLRQFTGGYHANTYFSCNLIFAICYTILLIVYNCTAEYFSTYAGATMIIFSCITFLFECPVENKNKAIPVEKKNIHKFIAVLLCLIYGIVGIKLIPNKIGIVLLYTLILISILVIVAKFQDIERRWKNEKDK